MKQQGLWAMNSADTSYQIFMYN